MAPACSLDVAGPCGGERVVVLLLVWRTCAGEGAGCVGRAVTCQRASGAWRRYRSVVLDVGAHTDVGPATASLRQDVLSSIAHDRLW